MREPQSRSSHEPNRAEATGVADVADYTCAGQASDGDCFPAHADQFRLRHPVFDSALDPNVREALCRAFLLGSSDEAISCAQTVGIGAVPWLVHWLRDRDAVVRRRAYSALLSMSGEEIPARLALHIRDLRLNSGGLFFGLQSTEHFSESLILAMNILDRNGTPQAVAEVVGLLAYRDEAVAIRAAEFLAELGADEVAGAIADSLRERQRQSRLFLVVERMGEGFIGLLIFGIWLNMIPAGTGAFGVAQHSVVEAISRLAPMFAMFGPAMIAGGRFGRWGRFRRRVVRLLARLNDPRFVGALAACATERTLSRHVIPALISQLGKVSREWSANCAPSDVEALLRLGLTTRSDKLFCRIARALSYTSDRSAIAAFERIGAHPKSPESRRNAVREALPTMRLQREAQFDRSRLMRAAGEQAERLMLLRAPIDANNDTPGEIADGVNGR